MTLFSYFANATCATKRTPAISGGKRGAPSAYLSNVPCTPAYPVDAETLRRVNLNTPYQVRRAFVFGDYDIAEGDLVTISGTEYQVSRLEKWDAPRGKVYRVLYLQDLKG